VEAGKDKPVSAQLEQEVEGPPWVYPWPLGDGRETPVMAPELPSVHTTRAELIEARVRESLNSAGPDAVALDLACNEGWFAHRLLEWGASRVLAIDVREHNIRRAALIRDHFGISDQRLELRCADVFDLGPADLGGFDVVLVLGLIYHVENPMGVIRLAQGCTRDLCVIESQLTRQSAPLVHGQGRTGVLHEASGSFAIVIEQDEGPILSSLASTGDVLSLIPNRDALDQMARVAGFERREFAIASDHHNRQYREGDRAVLLASRG
jgi:tRNA (mo5U34)-methyltransferase